jgi:hypothetical protein
MAEGDMLKHLLLATSVLALAGSPALAKTKKPAQPAPVAANAIVQAEQDFAAFTATHGHDKGFFAWSTPDALSFEPAPVKIHAQLADKQAEPDAASSLTWWPSRTGMASSGDLGYDLGGWTDGDKAGWFLTVWQKQADGSWKWIIDTTAGTADAASLPAKTALGGDIPPFAQSDSPKTAWDELNAADGALDKALATQDANTAYTGYLTPISDVLSDSAAPATMPDAVAAALAARPAGLTWSLGATTPSVAGDFGTTWGQAADASGVKGYYVRVWRKDKAEPTGWRIVMDLYRSAS